MRRDGPPAIVEGMTPRALELYLHRHIPLSKAMEVRVIGADEKGVELEAPLSPNLNHRGTAFGGSVSSLAVLSAWAFLHVRLAVEGQAARIVIQKSEFIYLKPIPGAFRAFCPAPPAPEWEKLLASLNRKGKGRIALEAEVRCAGAVAGRFAGDYVTLSAE